MCVLENRDLEERETISNGLEVAAHSGFADIVLNPNTYPVPDSSGDIVFLMDRSSGHATRLHPLGAMTVQSKGEGLAELFDMKKAGAVGFYDFKQAVANSNLLKIALQYAQVFDGLIMSFPMDLQIAGHGIVNEGKVSTTLGLKGIPALSEELQIARDLFNFGIHRRRLAYTNYFHSQVSSFSFRGQKERFKRKL